MRRSANLSSSSSNPQVDAKDAQSAAGGNEDRILSPTRRLTGSRRSRPISGDFDYDSINHPLPKAPQGRKGNNVSLLSISLYLVMTPEKRKEIPRVLPPRAEGQLKAIRI